MNNPTEVFVNGEIAYRYVKNPYYYITKTGILYSTYIKGAHGKYDINRIRKVAYGQDEDGYYRVILSLDKKRTYRTIHQIVADQFLGECPKDLVINHKDGNKHNNNVENLEFVTNLENIQHAWQNGLNSKYLNPNRISIDVLDNISNNIVHCSSIEEVKNIFGYSWRYINAIRNNEIVYNYCWFNKVETGNLQTDYYIECYNNGKLFKIFPNNEEAGKYFGKSKNTISYKTQDEHTKNLNRYTLIFPNVSTTESIAV